MSERKHVSIYTDGACLGNPGQGGYGVVLMYGPHRKELSGGFRHTTNNRMELMAVIKALQSLKEPCVVSLYSDSKYIVDAVNKGWAARWRRNAWQQKGGKRAANSDLWEELLQECETHEVEFVWVKGHAGDQENERCDALAVAAAHRRGEFEIDEFYEALHQTQSSGPSLAPAKQASLTFKIHAEGEPCRHCQTPVEKRIPKAKAPRPGQRFVYDYYLECPGCQTQYTVEDARRPLDPQEPVEGAQEPVEEA